MAQATINNPEIFDRKNFLKEQYNSLLIKETPSFELRRKILASQNADGLSEQDLRNQVSELRMRKIFSAIPLFGVPVGVYYFNSNPRFVFLSLIPAYFLYNVFYNSRILNREVEFSADFANNSKIRYYEKVLGANGKHVVKPEEMWNEPGFTAGKKTESVKEWIARHEYR
jgi:hypothetical protein